MQYISGFNEKYYTDGTFIYSSKTNDTVRPKVKNGHEYYRLVRPDGKKCERTLDSLILGCKKQSLIVNEEERLIVELVKSGKTNKEIAEIVNRDPCTISKVAIRNGLLRGRGGLNDKTRELNDKRHKEAVLRRGNKKPTRDKRRKMAKEYDPSVCLGSLIVREGLVCNMCGITCSKDDRTWGSFGPTYPTLDHIIPLSKGGTHTWDNVQLLCGRCNCIIKRDK